MENFLMSYGSVILNLLIMALGVMFWGRITDRMESLQEKIDAQHKEIDTLRNDIKPFSDKLSQVEKNILAEIAKLKDTQDLRYVSKELCAFYHKGE